jgi:hypothetical protein
LDATKTQEFIFSMHTQSFFDAAALLGHRLDGNKMESNNNSNSNKMDVDEGEEVTVVTSKYWPHMKILCTKNDDVVFKILNAVDECKCTTELNANNTDYPKGNNWNRLYDHCFGGGSQGCGLLAGHIPKASLQRHPK